MKSFQGHLLLAAPHQLDPNFVATVILVVEHADRGAFGVIVNCPKDRHEPVARQPSARRRRRKGPRAGFGGPMAGPLMAVHADECFAEIEVLPGVYFAGREKNVRALMQRRKQFCKVFSGYVGWGPGQLEREVEEGIWRTIPATAARIFSSGDNQWESLLKQSFDSLLQVMCNIKHIPSDASLN